MAIDEDLEGTGASKIDIPTSAPNISINIQPRRNKFDLYTTATVGVILQVAVLLFAGLTTYYPPWKLQKDGREIQFYAFPLTAAGTLAMAAGVLICSFVVEQSSEKVNWKANRDDCGEARILWLQRHSVVGDQHSSSFTIFAEGKRNSILTSRRPETYASTSYPENTCKEDGRNISPRLSNLVVVGALISIAGFVVQFTGLRAMNWSTAIMQLAATLIMTCLRSWVRRDLTKRPITIGVPGDHEIDWLATRIARCQQEHWPDDEEHFENFQHWNWEGSIMKGADVAGQFNPKSDCGSRNYGTMAQRVMKTREHLGQLCGWTGPAPELAACVAKSIEDTMNILFPRGNSNIFVWSLKAQDSLDIGVEQDIHFMVRREEAFWVANTAELEAALSLWLFAAHEEEERQKTKRESKEDKDWLGCGEAAETKQCMQLLCERTVQSLRDLSWWVPSGATQLLRVNQLSDRQICYSCDSSRMIELENYRIVEGPRCKVEPKSAHGTTKYECQALDFGNGEIGNESETEDCFLAMVSKDALAVIFARTLFSYFISTIADRINPIGGETTVSQLDPTDTNPEAWKNLKLENSILLRIAQAVERTGLGNLQEAYTCIIPPLHLKKALPSPLEIIELAQMHEKSKECAGHWQQAGAIYRWLLQISSTFEAGDDISIKTIPECMEFCRRLSIAMKIPKTPHSRKEAFTGLENLITDLLSELKTVNKEVTSHLAWMYQQRVSLDGLEDLRSADNEIGQSPTLLEDKLGHYPLHQSILSPEPYQSIQSNSLIKDGNLDRKDILGWTPLHLASTKGERLVIPMLLQAGADPNSKNIAGWTPLHYFSLRKHGDLKTAWVFLQAGADVDSRGRDGLSPLHCAATCNNEMMVKLLIESGADMEIQDNSQKTPLHWAAHNGSLDAVQTLVDKGACLHSQEYNKMTPLHLAAGNGQCRVADELVTMGADIHAKDKLRYCALHWAAEAGDEATIEKLFALGGCKQKGHIWTDTTSPCY